MSLLDAAYSGQPLAARMRPLSLDDYVGQAHIVGAGKPLREALAQGAVHSLILWGPPGVGKTTLARLLAAQCGAHMECLSAVLAGVKEIRHVVEVARYQQAHHGRRTLVFVDEVHRFNKAQQDAFLPFIEDGTFIFVGATTENPSFELNNALLSRTRVYVLKRLERDDLKTLLSRTLTEPRGLGARRLTVTDDAAALLFNAAEGDARCLLNLLENAADLLEDGGEITETLVASLLGERVLRFDKNGDAFYDQISALHKSVRGSAPDAALYWLARLLTAGCDPVYIARRVVRIASEDIGNADPRALSLAMSAWDVQERLGHPEGELALAQAVVYLACAPKSNAVYQAFNAAKRAAVAAGSLDVPLHLRNAPTGLMQQLGYGEEYRYAHDEPDAYAAGETYLPDGMEKIAWYRPVPRGLEIKIAEKLALLRKWDEEADKK